MKEKVIFWEGSKSNFALWGERVRNQKTCEELLMKLKMRVKVRGKGNKYRKEKKMKIPRAIEEDKRCIDWNIHLEVALQKAHHCYIHRKITNLIIKYKPNICLMDKNINRHIFRAFPLSLSIIMNNSIFFFFSWSLLWRVKKMCSEDDQEMQGSLSEGRESQGASNLEKTTKQMVSRVEE